MSSVIVAILLVVAIIAVVYFLVKHLSVIIVNAIVGLVLLVVMNFLHIIQWMGKLDLGYDLATHLCYRGRPRGLYPCTPRYFRDNNLKINSCQWPSADLKKGLSHSGF